MKYVALLTGSGEGCDYTIGCNKNFKVFEAPDDVTALKRCKVMWEDRGGATGEPRVEEIELFSIAGKIDVPIYEWNSQSEEEAELVKNEALLHEAEERAKELRQKLGR